MSSFACKHYELCHRMHFKSKINIFSSNLCSLYIFFFWGGGVGGQLKKMSTSVYELTMYQEHKLLLKSKHPNK